MRAASPVFMVLNPNTVLWLNLSWGNIVSPVLFVCPVYTKCLQKGYMLMTRFPCCPSARDYRLFVYSLSYGETQVTQAGLEFAM